MYGRPLFAFYSKEGSLNNAKMNDFSLRLVLSDQNYKKNLSACFSVLGTRVQMGLINSFTTASNLISGGYACLVDFELPANMSSWSPHAKVAFMPDPVCATIAMRFMNKNYKFQDGKLESSSKQFWVGKAKMAFESKLCLPEKGNIGEVFAALYMLLCGDVLRAKRSSDLTVFSISLQDWFGLLKQGGRSNGNSNSDSRECGELNTATRPKRRKQDTGNEQGKMTAPSSEISFIQVCRNDFRSKKSFFDKTFLEYLYCSGVGTYTYSNCKAVDFVGSIKVRSNLETDSFHPLFVSIKNWARVSNFDLRKWEASIRELLGGEQKGQHETTNRTTAVCLILLLGCNSGPSDSPLDDNSLDPFPKENVIRLVRVPADDNFNISDAIQILGFTSEKSEIYSSHSFLTSKKSTEDLSDCLRHGSTNLEELNSLFRMMHQDHKETGQV